ncbi:hypothetical protein JCM11251_005603 [Rhodosporidiobolus azoricus]
MSSRPRRSTAAADFKHLLTPINLTSSSSSSGSSDDGEGGDAAGPSSAADKGKNKDKKQKKPRKRAMYIPSESSGSEFDAGAPGNSPSAGEEELSDDAADEVDDEPDDLKYDHSSGDEALGSDGGSVVGVGGSPPSEVKIPGRRGKGVGGIGRQGGRAGGVNAAQNPTMIFSASAASTRRADGDPPPSRAKPPNTWPLSGWDAQYRGTGPLATWGMPSMVFDGEKAKGIMGAEVALPSSASARNGKGRGRKGKGKEKDADGEGVSQAEGTEGMTDLEVSRMLEGWTAAPFAGPSRGRARDLGWGGAGRWERVGDDERGREGEESRWKEKEGWGEPIEARAAIVAQTMEEIPPSALSSYIPVPLPTLHQSAERYTITVPHPSSSASFDSTAASPSPAAGPSDGAFLLPPPPPRTGGFAPQAQTGFAADELPTPPASFFPAAHSYTSTSTSTAEHMPTPPIPALGSVAATPRAQSVPDGSLTLLLGGGAVKSVDGGSEDAAMEDGTSGEGRKREKKVTLKRWESLRLDSYLPDKSGHIFNAGGPINVLSWAPRPRRCRVEHSDFSFAKEYLALSTLSTLETPLRHVTPSSDAFDYTKLANSPAFHGQLGSRENETDGQEGGKTRGGMVQIWSLSQLGGDVEGAGADGQEMMQGSEEEDVPMDGLGGSIETEKDQKRKGQGGMKFEMGLCLNDEGEAWELGWCPLGGVASSHSSPLAGNGMDVDNLASRGEGKLVGVLGGAFEDGSIGFFAVEEPEIVRRRLGKDGDEPVFVKPLPLLKVRLPNASLFSFAWDAAGGRVAGGASNGWVAVWNVRERLRRGLRGEVAADAPLRPTHYFPAHSSVIRSLTFISTPPPSLSSPSGAAEHDISGGYETGIVSTGYDGSTVLSDLRTPCGGVVVLNHERTPGYTVAYSPHVGCVFIPDQDDRVKGLYLRPSEIGRITRITPHRGAILSVATSPHHPFVLSTSVDGSCLLTSGVRAFRVRRVKGHFTQKLFRVELNRKTGEVRVWDNLDVEYRQALDPTNPISQAAKKKKNKKNAAAPHEPYHLSEQDLHTSAWPLEQGILKAVWHPDLERCALVATGWACGVGRVEWCESDE